MSLYVLSHFGLSRQFKSCILLKCFHFCVVQVSQLIIRIGVVNVMFFFHYYSSGLEDSYGNSDSVKECGSKKRYFSFNQLFDQSF